MKEQAIRILDGIIHPETEQSIVKSGIVEEAAISDRGIKITLSFPKSRDPFATSIKRQAMELLAQTFPDMKDNISIIVKEGTGGKGGAPAKKEQESGLTGVKKIIAVSSAKGGVGKSTVAVNLAVTLASMGYATGILDADIYGPSMPKMLGLEGFLPEAREIEGNTYIIPTVAYGIKAISIGFFINPDDALVWRGPMATGALKQLIHQTDWGALDVLVIDMPPGTGDVHLTLLGEMKVDGAVIVSTPQEVALADVVRGIAMFRSEHINVPVVGIIENMAWFTPEELPDKKYYIFGHGGAADLAEKTGIPLLGQIPLVISAREGGDSGKPAVTSSATVAEHYEQIARAVVNNLP